MDDANIVKLYFNRDERALDQTAERYGAYCYAIAHRILHSREDAEESVNDTWLQTWNSIPPQNPNNLATFLAKLTRNNAINRVRSRNAQKRGGGVYSLALEELDEVLGGGTEPEETLLAVDLRREIDAFLEGLPVSERRVFLQRYWSFCTLEEIVLQFGYSIPKTRTMLYRTRRKLKKYLIKRGVLDETI